MRCAWCNRIKLGDRFVDAEAHLAGDVPERLRERTTHGICPACLERESADAEAHRARPR